MLQPILAAICNSPGQKLLAPTTLGVIHLSWGDGKNIHSHGGMHACMCIYLLWGGGKSQIKHSQAM